MRFVILNHIRKARRQLLPTYGDIVKQMLSNAQDDPRASSVVLSLGGLPKVRFGIRLDSRGDRHVIEQRL
jgi:hypothetical protein